MGHIAQIIEQDIAARRDACDLGEAALRALPLVPARQIGVADRVGSLEPGKDADFQVTSGDPLDPRSHVKLTLVNGRIVYERDAKRPRF